MLFFDLPCCVRPPNGKLSEELLYPSQVGDRLRTADSKDVQPIDSFPCAGDSHCWQQAGGLPLLLPHPLNKDRCRVAPGFGLVFIGIDANHFHGFGDLQAFHQNGIDGHPYGKSCGLLDRQSGFDTFGDTDNGAGGPQTDR